MSMECKRKNKLKLNTERDRAICIQPVEYYEEIANGLFYLQLGLSNSLSQHFDCCLNLIVIASSLHSDNSQNVD